jgi:hypothetical protein
MRPAWTTGAATLRARMSNPLQVAAPVPEAEMPPYMESFLAHLRLLVGVPFDYLVPNSQLLPDESIRFFYLDRSWTDRLVDGAIAVGKIGTREQAHHQAHAPAVNQQLDLSERIVRTLQRRLQDFPTAKGANDQTPADLITGFILRSAAVSGWPHMDVRAFNTIIEPGMDVSLIPTSQMLPLLRLERLSPSFLIAMFEGVPQLVWCEEPHHGVQFAISETPDGRLYIPARDATGQLYIPARDATGQLVLTGNTEIPVPLRFNTRRVVAVAELQRRIVQKEVDPPPPNGWPAQTGAAGFAISVLNPPWRQRFQGAGGDLLHHGDGRFNFSTPIAATVERPQLQIAVKNLVTS